MQLAIPAALKRQSPTRGLDVDIPRGLVPTLSDSFVVSNPSGENAWWPFVPRPHYDSDGKENESQRSHLELSSPTLNMGVQLSSPVSSISPLFVGLLSCRPVLFGNF
ncbi:hypothetical protein CEXT_807061 [Caerostris extrusa]|uniref:Uncharacterized protein n=1 Tax=Caerostris extrusa TaxID=172846 RepID=A0AAV4NZK7_CAEEX|nr:hypothetical protein CEXT_807061 [Caerostris extrusa]